LTRGLNKELTKLLIFIRKGGYRCSCVQRKNDMVDIILGVALFTAIVSVLVLLILAVRSKLAPRGQVSITVNDEKTIEGPLGGKLLDTLAQAGIYLPSNCGIGQCGRCRVKVLKGGGDILLTETMHIIKREAAEGIYLMQSR